MYRAEDTNLGREVAIKVIPESFTADPERLARFEREARLLATLNHPNIAAVYEIGEADTGGGVRQKFLVMELAGGEDLAERLVRQPLDREEVLSIALQIARALEEAHERGVVHRDLKPANVKVTAEGQVKLLDFGLAKALTPQESSGQSVDLALSPTLTYQPTMAGVLLGTASYMSPEQARGKAVDRRTDIWAFGVVLYEMLTGRRVFAGETITDILASVVQSEPDLEVVPEGPLRRLPPDQASPTWLGSGSIHFRTASFRFFPNG